jgi:hypothetical protein
MLFKQFLLDNLECLHVSTIAAQSFLCHLCKDCAVVSGIKQTSSNANALFFPYPFRPVPAMPCTIWRWKKRKTINTGIPPSTAVAMICA